MKRRASGGLYPNVSRLLLVALAACAAPTEPMTFEAFVDEAHREPDTGMFVVNGDELVEDLDGMRAMYARYRDAFDGYGTVQQGLTINVVDGADDRWSSQQAQNLRYCVSMSMSQRDRVLEALEEAIASWEAAANVNFIHVTSQDSTCSARNTNVVFNVRMSSGSPSAARAFFPSSSRSARELVIDVTALGDLTPWTLAGVLRHELGHVLGFRHEHVRAPGDECVDEGGNWRGVTRYDSDSVMHYVQCGGTNEGDFVLTGADIAGAATVYPN